MRIILKNRWLYEIVHWNEERKLTHMEVRKIARGSGYFLVENFINWLDDKHPNALFRVDDDMRITGTISALGV